MTRGGFVVLVVIAILLLVYITLMSYTSPIICSNGSYGNMA